MYISKIIETADGRVEFKGEFTEEEHSFLLEFALQTLVARGMIPIKVIDDATIANMNPNTGSVN